MERTGRAARTCSARHAPGAQAPYNPFAQAWTAEHDWGLTDADLAELQAEQDGDQAYAEALQAALEQRLGTRRHAGNQR